MNVKQTIIRFPDLKLNASAGHKLRGYVAQLSTGDQDLLHNHNAEGGAIYRYPKVQYKVVDHHPMIVGIMEGSELLKEMFFKISELNLDGEIIPVFSKNISQLTYSPNLNQGLFKYRFKTLWMGLNQVNYKQYINMAEGEVVSFLQRCLTNNILSFYKGIGYWCSQPIQVHAQLNPHETHFKNKPMIAFSGEFVTNAFLPDYIGLGKSVSRGFGAIEQVK